MQDFFFFFGIHLGVEPVEPVENLTVSTFNNQAEEVQAVLANTKQILNQFLRKSRILSFISLCFL